MVWVIARTNASMCQIFTLLAASRTDLKYHYSSPVYISSSNSSSANLALSSISLTGSIPTNFSADKAAFSSTADSGLLVYLLRKVITWTRGAMCCRCIVIVESYHIDYYPTLKPVYSPITSSASCGVRTIHFWPLQQSCQITCFAFN